MKYIRTKDGIYEDAGIDAGGWRCVRYKGNKIALSQDDDEIVKEADTIKELCDEFVVSCSQGTYLCPTLGCAEGMKKHIDSEYGISAIIYVAIWTVGERGEPILKCVATINRGSGMETDMKKWLKGWWFSIVMWLFAIFIPTWTIIVLNLYDEDLIYLTMILVNCITPTLMLIGIGAANTPRKEKKDE